MRHGLNELVVGGVRYLLVGISSSHMAGVAEGDLRGRQALAEWRIGTEPWATSYDLERLLEPLWDPRILRGLEWIEMEPADGPTFENWGTGVYAPNCGNCLRIVSNQLDSVPPDERITVIVGLIVTDVLAEAGAVVAGVPGAQLEPLRAAIRQRFRKLGVPCRTYPIGGDLHVVSEQLWNDLPPDRRSEIERRTASTVAGTIQGRPVVKRRIDWTTWGVV